MSQRSIRIHARNIRQGDLFVSDSGTVFIALTVEKSDIDGYTVINKGTRNSFMYHDGDMVNVVPAH